MSFSTKVEEISPTMAHEYLAKSIGNRNLRTTYITALSVAMDLGKWNAEASEIVFDETGALIDGHHRLHAIIMCGKPIRILVKRGVDKAARGVIDTGPTRSVADLFKMFRPTQINVTRRRAALSTCVSLVAPARGQPPSIRTLDSFDAWSRVFAPGLEAIVSLTKGPGGGMNIGPVVGAFVFAHKTAPEKVEKFFVRTVEGLELKRNEPATTLRNLVFSTHGRNTGGERLKMSRKTLGAIRAHLRGIAWGKAQDGQEPLEFFREAYDTAMVKKMVDMWALDSTIFEVSPSAPTSTKLTSVG